MSIIDKRNNNNSNKNKTLKIFDSLRIGDEIHLGKTVSPFDSIRKSSAINRTASDFNNSNEKAQKIKKLISKGEYDEDVDRYIPGTLNLKFQGMLDNVTTREQPAHLSYKDMENLEFQIMLTQNHYTNVNTFHVCFPIKI